MAICRAEPARIEGSLATKFGYDSNPLATDGPTAALIGNPDSTVFSATGIISTTIKGLRVGYTGETFSYHNARAEDYSTHRIALSDRFQGTWWTGSVEASSVFVDGNEQTFAQSSSASGNAVALMRDRRRQWQNRGKVLLIASAPTLYVRTTLNVLDIDYHTNAVAGNWVFTDRRDIVLGVDGGRSPQDPWFMGARLGHQRQAVSPLPGASYEASNDYYRLVLGWESKSKNGRNFSIVGGPDFRRFTGNYDRRMLTSPETTSLWCEAQGSFPIGRGMAVAGKLNRWTFLSSVGKSAYVDTIADLALTWNLKPTFGMRLGYRAQQTDYVLAVRNDWQSHATAEFTWRATPRTLLSLELLRNRAWDGLDVAKDRSFGRSVTSLGVVRQF
ncbi:MAG: hypothetical protein U1F61_06750 [Opitutaceae bacterium]